MPYKDKEKQREYQRQWIASRRKAFFENKTCSKCGGLEDLELDHIDPTQKVSHRIWSWSATRRAAEIAKCQILCYPCHLKKTIAMYPDWEHGTDAMYRKAGCRCPVCKEYSRNAKARWRNNGM